jgi:hypothetical protein
MWVQPQGTRWRYVRLWAGLKEAPHVLRRPAMINRLMMMMERWEVLCIVVGLGGDGTGCGLCLGHEFMLGPGTKQPRGSLLTLEKASKHCCIDSPKLANWAGWNICVRFGFIFFFEETLQEEKRRGKANKERREKH